MYVAIVTVVLSVCCLYATAAPQTNLPWQKLSAASPVHHDTDDILRFEPLKAVDEMWEAFKAEYSMTLDHMLHIYNCI